MNEARRAIMRGGPFRVNDIRRLILLALVVAIPASADKPADVVKYRQHVMKAMNSHMAAMSMVVKKQISDRSQLAAHAAALRDTSVALPALFPPGSGHDKVRSEAKPEIWQRFGAFKASADALQRESETLAELAKKGDARAFDAQFEKVAGACAACHQTFRTKDDD